MAFKVSLNLEYPHGLNQNASWYDPITGVNLTIVEPESRDIEDSEDLTNIIIGLEAGTIVVSDGIGPDLDLPLDVNIAAINGQVPVGLNTSYSYSDVVGVSADLPAGSTWELDSYEFDEYDVCGVAEFTASSTVPIKIEIFVTLGGVRASNPSRVFYTDTSGDMNFRYQPVDYTIISGTGQAGVNKFTLRITNMEEDDAADIHASITTAIKVT